MSDLTINEQNKLERLLKMERGYVLNFSNSTFQSFIKEAVKIDIYDNKYKYKSGSKANRLRAIWAIENNAVVAQLIKALLAYWKNQENTLQEKDLYRECKEIVSRLRSDTKKISTISNNKTPKSHEMDHQKEQSRASVPKEKKKAPFKRLTNHLLIIGIDKYQDQHISDLNNAVKDAKAFKKTLIEQYQFEEKNTTCLFNEQATRNNILSTFDQLLNKLTKNDNLIFYYSGHGELVKTGKIETGYWIPHNATSGSRYSYVSNSEIIGLYKASFAHHIFGIVDSCFSGSLFYEQRSTVETNLFYHTSRWLLTAGLLEPVSDGSLGNNSPFAKTLLYYLNENRADSLWVSALCVQVLQGVGANSKNQTPKGEPLHGVGHYGGQFIFYKKGYTPNEEEIEKILDGQNKSIAPATSTPDVPKKVESTPPQPAPQTTVKTSFTDLADLKKHLKLLAEDDIGVALKMYQSSLAEDSRKVNDIIGQLGRYNRSNKDFNNGLTTIEQRKREFARIAYALTQMIDDLAQGDIGIMYQPATQMEFKKPKNEAILTDLAQLEQKGLHQQASLLTEKINDIKEALYLEDDPTRRLKYKKQIAEAEEQLKDIKTQLE